MLFFSPGYPAIRLEDIGRSMDGFRTVEGRFERTPVRVVDGGANGVLHLRGRKTVLHISGNQPFGDRDSDENGWFNLRLQAANGRELLLHNALMLRRTTHGWIEDSGTAHSAEIYPNIVIDDTRGLSPDNQIQSISFRLRGLESFFHYRHAQSLRGHGASADQVEALRAMSDTDDKDAVFAPREVYVVHRYPRFFEFRVADRTYSVWAGGYFSGGGWHRVDARVVPIATIAFDQPIDLDTALGRLWEWRRFFNQMAMQSLAPKSIVVRGSLDEHASSANVYLPNLKRRSKKIKGRYALSPRHITLNRWADRDRLADAMQAWLARSEQRDGFRQRLDLVIERMNRRLDPRDLVDLGSAADSLEELSTLTPLPSGALHAMVDAALRAGLEASADINRDRISGLLGSIARPSLAMRFMRMGDTVSPAVNRDDIQLLVRSATRIRNASAHGGELSDQVQPRLGPTVQAIAALAARFDLETCSTPEPDHSGRLSMPHVMFEEAVQELREIEAGSR